MSKVYGVKCDRCGEVLSASSASKLASLFDEWGWESRTVGRSRMDWCEPCQEANEAMRRAIVEKLSQV
jgi:hypothetical protein